MDIRFAGFRTPAFTLLEVLLAVAITAAVLAVAYSVVASTLTARDRAQAATASVSVAQSVQWLVREDLRGLAPGQEDAGAFRAAPPTGAGAVGDFLSFVTTFSPWPGTQAGGLSLVGYRLTRNAEDGKLWDLHRAQTPWPPRKQVAKSYAPVLRRIQSLSVEYFTGSSWQKAWPPTEAAPVAVRLILELPGPEARQPQRFRTEIWLPTGGAPPAEDDGQTPGMAPPGTTGPPGTVLPPGVSFPPGTGLVPGGRTP